MIASVKETSPFMVRRICDRMDLARRRVVVEYGPGTGPFTRALLDRLSPDSRLILIESNPEFAAGLQRRRDPRARVFRAGAEEVLDVLRASGVPRADYILSGIPFSRIEDVPKMRILRDTRRALAEDGAFLAYQSSALLRKPLEEVFGEVRVAIEPFHIPPMVVLEARGGGPP
jgi:phosphatidylethanolamine/phosphatidyl-N-methylethanolamine N-methyltransferase